MKSFLTAIVLTFAAVLGGCANDAQVARQNLNTAADNFQIFRRVVFYNSLTDGYMLSIEGLCSFEHEGRKLTVICKDGSEYKKHTLGISDNVTYFVEQLSGAAVSTSHYKVIFKPSVIIPSVEMR